MIVFGFMLLFLTVSFALLMILAMYFVGGYVVAKNIMVFWSKEPIYFRVIVVVTWPMWLLFAEFWGVKKCAKHS